MKERPIIFGAAMVKAIPEGRKSQTRRVIKPQPIDAELDRNSFYRGPYGIPGDRLWVREQYWAWGKWVPNGVSVTGRKKWKFVPVGTSLRFQENPPTKTATRDGECGWVYRHARYMPKAHSRITLEITDVRVQRLQEISEEDAQAEGVHIEVRENGALDPFRRLWDSINAKKYPWDTNPWVWAVTFARIT